MLKFEDFPPTAAHCSTTVLFSLSRNNTSIHYRLQERRRVTKGVERGELFVPFVSSLK